MLKTPVSGINYNWANHAATLWCVLAAYRAYVAVHLYRLSGSFEESKKPPLWSRLRVFPITAMGNVVTHGLQSHGHEEAFPLSPKSTQLTEVPSKKSTQMSRGGTLFTSKNSFELTSAAPHANHRLFCRSILARPFRDTSTPWLSRVPYWW